MPRVHTTIRLEQTDKAAFESAAAADGLSLTAWLVLAGKEKLRRLARETAKPVEKKGK